MTEQRFEAGGLVDRIAIWTTQGLWAFIPSRGAKKTDEEPAGLELTDFWGLKWTQNLVNLVGLAALLAAVVLVVIQWTVVADPEQTSFKTSYGDFVLPNIVVCNVENSSVLPNPPYVDGLYFTKNTFASERIVDAVFTAENTTIRFDSQEMDLACVHIDTTSTPLLFSSLENGIMMNVTVQHDHYPNFYLGLYSSPEDGTDDIREYASLVLLSGFGTFFNVMFYKNRNSWQTERSNPVIYDEYRYVVTSEPFYLAYIAGRRGLSLNLSDMYSNPRVYRRAFVQVLLGSSNLNSAESVSSIFNTFNQLGGYWGIFELLYLLVALFLYTICVIAYKITKMRLVRTVRPAPSSLDEIAIRPK